jgi:predicted lipoprotein with Yx(FWY)xxD motif
MRKNMSVSRAIKQRTLRAALPVGVLGLVFVSACVDDQPGIVENEAGAASAGKQASAGSTGDAGAENSPEGGGAATAGSSATQAGTTAVLGGSGGGSSVDVGGAPSGGDEGGHAGQGDGGAGTTPVAMDCSFHTDAAGDPGTGGAPPAANVVLQTNAFLGSYLTDAAGRTLYTYGADLPGDCKTPPLSTCVADCVVSWPPFDAGARVLGAGLDDAAFGAIDRGDGTWQTTYYGWPLYYYKADLTLGQLTGQGKGKTWHAAELTPPSVQIMKAGALKYLGSRIGRTLYVSAFDQVGTLDDDPVSTCEGDCLASFTPFRDKHLSVVTSLEEADFSVFVRKGSGGLQLAYKGMPLYSAVTDQKSGDTTGLATTGFTAAVP